ncbi:MAG: hypothetical protein ACKOCM_08415 [Cyanobacteriota bacterium]
MPRLLTQKVTTEILTALLLQGVIVLAMTLLMPWIGCTDWRHGQGSGSPGPTGSCRHGVPVFSDPGQGSLTST